MATPRHEEAAAIFAETGIKSETARRALVSITLDREQGEVSRARVNI